MNLKATEVWSRIDSVKHWYHQIEIRPGIVTPGTNDAAATLRYLDIPSDLRGKRVLDLGARDGFFSFAMARRGAEVLAVDYVSEAQTGFRVAAELLNADVAYQQENIYNLSPEKIGRFDIVLFLGLLYHLPDPMLAINIVRSLCIDRLCLETHAIDNALIMRDGTVARLADVSPALVDVPIMQFYPGRTLNDDPTNYWGPNLKCLEAMLGECGFGAVSSHLVGSRAIVNCRVVQDADLEYHGKIARGLNLSA